MEQESTNLPAEIADAIVSIPKGLTPGVIKALDRLISATIDIPVAWLNQQAAKIECQTESYKLVEARIAESAAATASQNSEITDRAINALVRKEYRKQVNREAVAAAMLEEIQYEASAKPNDAPATASAESIDDDWLNVFERYAEDASSERLQKLWGRVLAGEIRQSGRYSVRTLRFLSEFSKEDAQLFEEFSKCAFGDFVPKVLVAPEESTDIGHLVDLESSGLIQGSSGHLHKAFKTNEFGYISLAESNIRLVLKGTSGQEISCPIIKLTPLGQELLSLVGSRDVKEAAKTVAYAIRSPSIKSAYIAVNSNKGDRITPTHILW